MLSITEYHIRHAEPKELEALLKLVLDRYHEVFPDWELSVLTIEKSRDRNTQIDEVIAVLNGMKV